MAFTRLNTVELLWHHSIAYHHFGPTNIKMSFDSYYLRQTKKFADNVVAAVHIRSSHSVLAKLVSQFFAYMKNTWIQPICSRSSSNFILIVLAVNHRGILRLYIYCYFSILTSYFPEAGKRKLKINDSDSLRKSEVISQHQEYSLGMPSRHYQKAEKPERLKQVSGALEIFLTVESLNDLIGL